MEEIKNNPERNPFEDNWGLRSYASRNGSDFSNFENLVSEVDKERYARIVLNQALEQAIYWIDIYLETRNSSSVSEFGHGLVYMRDIIKEISPEANNLFEILSESTGSVGTDEEVDYSEILKKLRKIKEELKLDYKDYFDFAQEKGVSKEKILTECISWNLSNMIPRWKAFEDISRLEEEWKLLKDKSFKDFAIKSRELLDKVVQHSPAGRFYSYYFPLIQALNEADLSSNFVH